MTQQSDKQRIADLEAELEQLRAGAETDAETEAPPALIGDVAAGAPSLTKVVALGTVVVVLALAFFLAIYTGISKGFDSLAYKAAQTYASDLSEEGAAPQSGEAPTPGNAPQAPSPQRPDAPQRPATPQRPAAPRVPGL